MSRGRGAARRAAGLATVVVLAAGCSGEEAERLPEPRTATCLAELDLAGVEPAVAARIEALRLRAALEPDRPAAWGELAITLDVHDLRRESIPCYHRAATLDPGELRWPYYGAIALSAMGEPEALAWLERSRGIAPGYVPLEIRYAESLLGAGREVDAERALRRALELGPDSSHAYLGLARIALARDDPAAARDLLLRARELQPAHGEVHRLSAEVSRRLDRPREAERMLRRARELPEETPLPDPLAAAWAGWGRSLFWHQMRGQRDLEAGRWAQAATELERAIALEPTARDHNNFGTALRHLGRREEAVEHFRAALDLDPDYPEALVNLGITLFELGSTGPAIASLERAVALDPSLVAGFLNLGQVYLEIGRRSDALGAFRRGLEARPDQPQLALRRAWLLATAPEPELRDGAEALRLARQARDAAGGGEIEPLDTLAAAYAELGEFERAARAADEAYAAALAAGRRELAAQIRSRLDSYRAHRPYRTARPSRRTGGETTGPRTGDRAARSAG